MEISPRLIVDESFDRLIVASLWCIAIIVIVRLILHRSNISLVPEDDDEGTAKTDALVVIIILLHGSPATPEGSVEGGRIRLLR